LGELCLNLEGYVGELKQIWASFPDLHFETTTTADTGAVVTVDLQVSGTHSGVAYGFGPYDPIPTTGKKVKNDSEYLTFHVDTSCNKSTQLVGGTNGEMVGPQGFYTQIGGFPLL